MESWNYSCFSSLVVKFAKTYGCAEKDNLPANPESNSIAHISCVIVEYFGEVFRASLCSSGLIGRIQ